MDVIDLSESNSLNILDVISSHNIVPSKSEVKRLITGGGIKIENDSIINHNYTFSKNDNGKILKVGKKKIFKLKYS